MATSRVIALRTCFAGIPASLRRPGLVAMAVGAHVHPRPVSAFRIHVVPAAVMALFWLAFITAPRPVPEGRVIGAVRRSVVFGLSGMLVQWTILIDEYPSFLLLLLVPMITCERMALLDVVPPRSRKGSDRVQHSLQITS